MFGIENVTAATDWLKAEPGRAIQILFDSSFRVQFMNLNGTVATGAGDKLMDALKAALAGLQKA